MDLTAWDNSAYHASAQSILHETLYGVDAKRWAAEQKALHQENHFKSYKTQFAEAIDFILNPETETPYVVTAKNVGPNGAELIGITGGKVEGDIAYRDWRIVRPDFEGRGVAHDMHTTEIALLPTLGVTSVYTEAYSAAGKKFIERHGYTPCTDGWYCLELKQAA